MEYWTTTCLLPKVCNWMTMAWYWTAFWAGQDFSITELLFGLVRCAAWGQRWIVQDNSGGIVSSLWPDGPQLTHLNMYWPYPWPYVLPSLPRSYFAGRKNILYEISETHIMKIEINGPPIHGVTNMYEMGWPFLSTRIPSFMMWSRRESIDP